MVVALTCGAVVVGAAVQVPITRDRDICMGRPRSILGRLPLDREMKLGFIGVMLR